LCPQVDVGDIFYPEKGGAASEAIRVCHRCPVIHACLAYALEHNERYGVWGGKSERQRRRLKRDQLGGAA
jgi:WhiB family redox-sensing transcriptional regulator